MSCTIPTPDMQAALDRIGQTHGIPTDEIEAGVLATLKSYGWVYEWRGVIDLTGAGAWHADTTRTRAGLLE